MKCGVRLTALSLFFLMGMTVLGQGNIRGSVRSDAGILPGALAKLTGSSFNKTAVTDSNGVFRFNEVPAGTYKLVVSFTGMENYESDSIAVKDGDNLNLQITMIAPLNIQEVLTVQSASRKPERIVEAPAAVTVVTSREIATQAASGQIPKVLENTPGVELAQNDVFDFNINARGFNSSLNRRILVLIDGRDPATSFLGNQEWSALSMPLDDIESMELVRGPGSALYGANAFNGVLNIRSKRPIEAQGGRASISGGELGSRRLDLRYAGEFGFGWAYRINAGTWASETWSKSRTAADRNADGEFEYPGLGPSNELVSIEDDLDSVYGTIRFDREFLSGRVLTFEGGYAEVSNGVAVTGIGRVQIDKTERPWFRVNYNGAHFNLMYSNSQRSTPNGQTALSSGVTLWEDSVNEHVEAQFNYNFFDDKLELVGGVSYRRQDIDTRNNSGLHSLMATTREEDQQAVFGQASFPLGEKIDIVLAGRLDDSSLHDVESSPKAAVVWKVNHNHSLRFSYNEAFQVPNFSEFSLRAGASTVIPFSQIQDAVVLNGFGLDLRNMDLNGGTLEEGETPLLDWQDTNVIAAGNPNLVNERTQAWEVGYKGIIGSQLFLTVDYYQSTIENFVTDLLPGVNDLYGPLTFNENVPGAVQNTLRTVLQQILGDNYVGLSNVTDLTNPLGVLYPEGAPILVLSYTNAGEVDTRGVDVAFNFYIDEHWVLDGNYSWFDFEVIDKLVGDALIPNSAESKVNLGISYNSDRMNASLKVKSVEGFDWSAGVFQGEIPAYTTVNLTFDYKFGDRWKFAIAGNNLLNDEHIELFGGSVNKRRVLASITMDF